MTDEVPLLGPNETVGDAGREVARRGLPPVTEADAGAPPGTVQCPCGKYVAPTIPGGSRPRPHNDNTGRLCARIDETYTAARCKRCGGEPHQPQLVSRGPVSAKKPATKVRCTSHVFHPETWTVRGELVGNPAACGEVLGVSGEQWQWRTRQPAEDSPSRAPAPDGYDFTRRTPYWRISVAEQVRDRLPSRNRGRGTGADAGAEA